MKKKAHELVISPDVDTESIGQFLKAARTSAGMVQTAVAEQMGIAQNVVARIEAGSGQATLATIARFGKALGLRCVLRLEP
jgi:transcriptional regulator with XRE-family HTH domain